MTVSPINITGDSGLSSEMKTYYVKKLLENLYGKAVYNRYGKASYIPMHGGKVIEFRRLAKLVANGTPLTEGTTPSGQNLTVSTVTATATQNGLPIYYSDILKTTTIDPIIDDAVSEQIPQNAIEVLENKAANVLAAGTNVSYAGSNTARSTIQDSDKLTLAQAKKIERDLKKNNVPTFADGYYVAVISPETAFDMMTDADWKDAFKNTRNVPSIYPGEVGIVSRTRYVESTFAKVFKHKGAGTDALHTTLDGAAAAGAQTIPLTSTTGLAQGDVCTIRSVNGYFEQEVTIDSVNAGVSVDIVETLDLAYASGDTFDKGDDVHASLFFGPNAYGVVSIDGLKGNKQVGQAAFEIIIKALGSAGSEDALNQRGSIGWKAMNAYVILDQLRIIRAEHGVTDGVS